MRALKTAIRHALLNSGKFSRVRFPDSPGPVPSGQMTYFDIRVRAVEEGAFNWVVTWPAIYPYTLAWPFQVKSGKVQLTLDVAAYRNNGKIFETTLAKEKEYSIVFYGFFRTSPIERQAMSGYEDLLFDLTKAVAEHDFSGVQKNR